MDLLKRATHIELGSLGVDDDPSNPFSRAVSRLFEDGQPFERIIVCYFGDITLHAIEFIPLRWLGVFILSAGGRIIFFPGFADRPMGIKLFRGQSLKLLHDNPTFPLDHLSLEKNRTQWHYTTPQSKNHLKAGSTVLLGDERYFWFGMSVARETGLREVKAETMRTTSLPRRDSERREEVFKNAIAGTEAFCVSLLPEARMRFQTGFLHFACIVGPRGFPDYQGPYFGIPEGFLALSQPSPDALKKLPIGVHRLSLGSAIDVQLLIMWLPGILREAFTFTGRTS